MFETLFIMLAKTVGTVLAGVLAGIVFVLSLKISMVKGVHVLEILKFHYGFFLLTLPKIKTFEKPFSRNKYLNSEIEITGF